MIFSYLFLIRSHSLSPNLSYIRFPFCVQTLENVRRRRYSSVGFIDFPFAFHGPEPEPTWFCLLLLALRQYFHCSALKFYGNGCVWLFESFYWIDSNFLVYESFFSSLLFKGCFVIWKLLLLCRFDCNWEGRFKFSLFFFL